MLFNIFASYALVIHTHMAMDKHLMRDAVATYTYSGYNALKRCEADRETNLKLKPEKGDTIQVSECKKV